VMAPITGSSAAGSLEALRNKLPLFPSRVTCDQT
jgi:hypothetical protein